MLTAPHFRECEFLPKTTFSIWGPKGMRFIDARIPVIVEWIREKYNLPVRINTWDDGGSLDGRCLRLSTNTAYTWHSCHTFGRAIDFDIPGLDPEKIRNDILNLYFADLKTLGLTAIELKTPTWVHLSVSDFSLWPELSDINGIKLIPMP
jgi:hypothetical protein